ncbi:NAD(P)H-hydrate dehydratase [Microbacterium sp. CFBP9023]|uniref:NAD(P)H-hydrate dehydratase n=1 Tax=Microbacterium sp. CFBP9023 TaxID=3096535 RepID=UPI002A6AB6AA|nr:NAD(P)H-hydrate dehydratase [Microbacterium sp. CFBP9023]MDY0982393.1 NAD(P)H-hydrate dehydratase [Microbacterium sp. CFBP9023]
MPDARDWSRDDTARLLRVPGADDDKYSRGVVGLRTGSSEYPGAAVLGVEAAWRAGAGFVRYIGEGRAADAVIARRPETVVSPRAAGARVGAWVIGSGTNAASRTSDEERELRDLLDGSVPVVVDAGALDLAPGSRAPLVLTPHRREFERLQTQLGFAGDDDRATAVARVASEIDATVLLKGAQTLIADPDGGVIRVEAGTGWLATAGTGDVLGGVLGALLAGDVDASTAEIAAAAAWLHGHAGRIAAGIGAIGGAQGHPIVALDVAEALPRAIADVIA